MEYIKTLAQRVSTFSSYKLNEKDITEDDREMWTEIKIVADYCLSKEGKNE